MKSTQRDEQYKMHVYTSNLNVVKDSAPSLVFSSKRVLKRTVETWKKEPKLYLD